MDWGALLAIVVAGLLIFLMVRLIKNNPDSFSSAALGKSFTTLGLLALVLIGFIALCIAILKGG